MAASAEKLARGAVLLLGGRSEIGVEIAERLAPGRAVVLAARRSDQLEAERARLLAAGASAVDTIEFDADAVGEHEALVATIARKHGPIGIAVLAFGILGDQERAEREAAHAVSVIQTDFVAQVSVLTTLANVLRAQGSGHIVVFGSIAGVRVRRANYVYGSAKAGLDGFAGGLADALVGSGVHLLLARPGFVIGRMTEGMKPAPMSITPDRVADAVVDGLARRARTIAIPGRLRLLFVAFRLTPGPIWRRMPR